MRNASTSSSCFFECPDDVGKNRPTARITGSLLAGRAEAHRWRDARSRARPQSRSTQPAVYGELADHLLVRVEELGDEAPAVELRQRRDVTRAHAGSRAPERDVRHHHAEACGRRRCRARRAARRCPTRDAHHERVVRPRGRATVRARLRPSRRGSSSPSNNVARRRATRRVRRAPGGPHAGRRGATRTGSSHPARQREVDGGVALCPAAVAGELPQPEAVLALDPDGRAG